MSVNQSLPDPDKPEEKPTFIEPVIGYRSWRLIKKALYPVTIYHGGAAWTAGENHARCYKIGGMAPDRIPWVPDDRHPAPHKDCNCGFYGTYDRKRSPDYSKSYWQVTYVNVYGIAAFWGEIKAHPFGIRAEYAQVLALEVPERDDIDLRPVAKRYRVPIRTREQLEAWVQENSSPLPESVIPENVPLSPPWPTFVSTSPWPSPPPPPARRKKRFGMFGWLSS